jgi:histidyl-tRNA synthetase
MALPTQPYKGARDFYPEDKRLQKYIFTKIRQVCESFGYEEYDAPILEPTELYLQKGNEEIVREQTYTFTDRGGREVTMRTEMTPTVSRMVAAKRQELPYPLRWYSIPQCWRYERMQRGRGREFYQLNVDVFGVGGVEADAEIIQVADDILKSLGAPRDTYSIKVNSRKLSDYILKDYLELDPPQRHAIAKLVDRMHKIPHETFLTEADAIFTPTQRGQGAHHKLVGILKTKTVEHLPEIIRRQPAARELLELMRMLEERKITNVRFDPTIVRGFDYYTGIVFEIFDEDPDNNRSMFGGGRYDGLVAAFGVETLPTTGFAMGDITLANFLQSHNLMPPLRAETDVYVVLIGDVLEGAQKVVTDMREQGVNVAIDISDKAAEKQIKTAVKKAIPYALFIGQKELTDEQYELKNLQTGVSERHSLARIISIIKDYRSEI